MRVLDILTPIERSIEKIPVEYKALFVAITTIALLGATVFTGGAALFGWAAIPLSAKVLGMIAGVVAGVTASEILFSIGLTFYALRHSKGPVKALSNQMEAFFGRLMGYIHKKQSLVEGQSEGLYREHGRHFYVEGSLDYEKLARTVGSEMKRRIKADSERVVSIEGNKIPLYDAELPVVAHYEMPRMHIKTTLMEFYTELDDAAIETMLDEVLTHFTVDAFATVQQELMAIFPFDKYCPPIGSGEGAWNIELTDSGPILKQMQEYEILSANDLEFGSIYNVRAYISTNIADKSVHIEWEII